MFPRIRKQTGNLYIVAVFVIVVMGFLATALSRMEWSNNDALTKELLGTKAWFATHSANELALTYLYPLNTGNSMVDSVCITNRGTVNNAVGQLQAQFPGCSIATSCNRIGTLKSESYYKVQSSAVCGSGQFQVARRQEVWVRE